MDSKLNLGAERYIRAVTEFVFVEDEPGQADIILVPGASRPEHALRAAELYQAGFAPYVLPSGGFPKTAGRFQGVKEKFRTEYPGAFETEWAFLREVLMRRGVPEEAILREDRATYTWENAQLSRRVTDAMGISVGTAILCCKSFHARRALLYYQAAYPETRFLVCPAQLSGYGREDWYLTEKGRAVVLGEVARLGDQVREVFENMLRREV